MAISAQEWLLAYASRLGTATPSDDEVDELLALAGIAAHGSERTAAPVACWMAAKAGCRTGEALAIAKRTAEALAEDDA
jgi:hypothetical protein